MMRAGASTVACAVACAAAAACLAWALARFFEAGRRCARVEVARADASVRYEVVPTPEDLAAADGMVEVRALRGRGSGVVAVRDIPAWTLLGPYPGRRYDQERHAARKERGASDEYACDFWVGGPEDARDGAAVVDPVGPDGALRPEYACVTPFVNEPGPRRSPNMVWVWNFPRYRIEMWTCRPVPRGRELTICYGQAYRRHGYESGCQRPGVEPVRYAITDAAQTRPRPYVDLVPQ